MKYRKPVALLLVIAVGLAVLLIDTKVGELRTPYRDIVLGAGTTGFDARQWARANEVQRGQMLVSLLRGHTFIGQPVDTVTHLLGERTCYWNTETIPCYWVILKDSWYLLAFEHDYDSKAIVAIQLSPRD